MCKVIYRYLAKAVAKEMVVQLKNNEKKGDRENWANITPMEFVKELYYHTGKLQAAIKEDNKEQIKEFCADIANLAGMTMDVTKVIDLDAIQPVKKKSTEKFNAS